MASGKILVIHGPNLNLLGEREVSLYGRTTLAQIDRDLAEHGARLGYEVETFQSNHEGHLIDRVQGARDACQGLLINPGGLTHTSVALLDALAAVPVPKVEVHVTNIFAREPFRRRSVTAAGVDAVVAGVGAAGYRIALEALIQLIEARSGS